MAESTQRRIVLDVVAAVSLLGLLAAFLGLGTALVLAIRAGVFSSDLVHAVPTWTSWIGRNVETETLVVSAGRGQRVRWRAVAGKSLAGRWRADDSDFKIDYDGPRDEVPFAPKVQVDGSWSEWGERISGGPDEVVVIRGWFTAPIVAGSDARSLRGRIRGTVLVPERAAGRTFSNLGRNVTIPLQVNLVPDAQAAHTLSGRLARRWAAARTALFVGLVGIALFAVMAAVGMHCDR